MIPERECAIKKYPLNNYTLVTMTDIPAIYHREPYIASQSQKGIANQ